MHVKVSKNGDMYNIEADDKGYTQILRSVDFTRYMAEEYRELYGPRIKSGFTKYNKLFHILMKIRNK